MQFTPEQYDFLHDQFWDAWAIRRRELERGQGDEFDPLAEDVTRELRRAGIDRLADEIAELIAEGGEK